MLEPRPGGGIGAGGDAPGNRIHRDVLTPLF
ncbi:MAG: hypothetical protein ACI8TQ_001509 [Planctomycetota bacterium]|jgi:hypothetical protein